VADDDDARSDARTEGLPAAPSGWTALTAALGSDIAVDPAATPRETDPLRTAVSLALGAAGLGLAAVRALLEPSPATGGSVVEGDRVRTLHGPGETAERFAVAAAGLGVAAQRQWVNAAETVGAPIATTLAAVIVTTMARGPVAAIGRRLGRWSDEGLAEQRRNQEMTVTTGRAVVRAVVAAVLAEVDLDEVVARVDLDRIIDRLDLDQISERLDLDAIAARLDLDAVASRLDVNAVVERVDLARVTEQVLDEVDVGHIVRESSGAMAAETVDAVRLSGMRADRFLSRIVDRVLMRADGRDTGSVLSQEPPAGPAASTEER
jgi:hypothetical protein